MWLFGAALPIQAGSPVWHRGRRHVGVARERPNCDSTVRAGAAEYNRAKTGARPCILGTMFCSSKTIGVAACFSLLMLQLSGPHIHADEHGYIGVPETSYSHSHTHDDHGADHHDGGVTHADEESGASGRDYGDARDVSLLDLALSAFKLTLALLVFAFLFTILPRVRTPVSADFVQPILSGRHTRWRPPLRAPPLLATV